MPLSFHYYHRRSADRTRERGTPPRKDWPKEWKTVYYKTYAGITSLPLPTPEVPTADFFDLVSKRKSVRGKHQKGISAQDLSVLLKYSCGLQDIIRREGGIKLRAQPSGGTRFPIEAYIVSLKKENEIAPGVYHYDVRKHALEVLRIRDFPNEEIAQSFTYPWSKDCSMALVLTAVFERSAMKYYERAYRFIMIEAGHIGQGVYLAGGSLGVGVVGMGGTRDDALHELLDVDGSQEALVYALMLSK